MFCEACGSRMEERAVVCTRCGTEVREALGETVQRVQTRPAAEPELQGPKCEVHPGMPLAGSCPRCGKPVCIRCAPEAARDGFTCTDCYGLTSAHQKAPVDASCAAHPELRAKFICSRCGSFACSSCAASGPGSEGQCFRCAPQAGQLASRGSRLGASLIDNVVLILPVAGAFLVAMVAVGGGKKMSGEEDVLVFALLGGLVLGCVIELVAQVQWGQSVGKRLLGIKVVRVNGQPIELWRLILLRNIVLSIAAQACGVIGLVDALMIFGDPQRCLHDYLADSIVIDVPPST